MFFFLGISKIHDLVQFGPTMGRFGSLEGVDDTLDELNHTQTSFQLVRINIRTVCFDFIADK